MSGVERFRLKDPIDNQVRLLIGTYTSTYFYSLHPELVEGQPTLTVIAEALLAGHTVLARELTGLEKRGRSLARRTGANPNS